MCSKLYQNTIADVSFTLKFSVRSLTRKTIQTYSVTWGPQPSLSTPAISLKSCTWFPGIRKWDEKEDHPEAAIWRGTLIKARNVSFKLPADVAPQESDHWSIEGSEYTVKFSDKELDLAILQIQFSHLGLPISLKPVGHGSRVYTVDVMNAFAAKVFDGRCRLSDESKRMYYDTDTFANYGWGVR